MAQWCNWAHQRPVLCTKDPSLADQQDVLPRLLQFQAASKYRINSLLGRANKNIGIVCNDAHSKCKLALLLLLFVKFFAILSHPLISIQCNMLKEPVTSLWVTFTLAVSTLAVTSLTRRPSSPNVSASSTRDASQWWKSLASWSIRRLSPLSTGSTSTSKGETSRTGAKNW